MLIKVLLSCSQVRKLEKFTVLFSSKKGQIKELEDCLGRLLVTQHRLQSVRANYTQSVIRDRLDSAIAQTSVYISRIRHRLTELYHENNIMDKLTEEIETVEKILGNFGDKTITPGIIRYESLRKPKILSCFSSCYNVTSIMQLVIINAKKKS